MIEEIQLPETISRLTDEDLEAISREVEKTYPYPLGLSLGFGFVGHESRHFAPFQAFLRNGILSFQQVTAWGLIRNLKNL